ncbi:agmatine deiminase family protein [Gallibacterium anatis]|uniref:agmatine deiminase family protein n=1 Tax=Gallibacterium anatis TaxID=750 RepID=UPI00057EBDD8|nr:agmatine deiminase family protein [Gallibacterium anatis]MBP4134146.1 agmatine deiminase family protein [Gallibacterium anatis]
MPFESATHQATWMAYGATAGAWGTTGVYGMARRADRADLMLIAALLNDLWVRDTAPLFVRDENGKRAAVDFNFNGWGQADIGAEGWRKAPAKREHGIVDQPIGKDQKIAAFIAQYTHSPLVKTCLVMMFSVLYRLLAHPERMQKASHYQTTFRLYFASLILTFGGLILALRCH